MKPNLTHPPRRAHVALALLLLLVVSARADLEDQITKTFKVQAGGQLSVEADRGSIEVKTVAEGDSVNIEVARKARGSQSKAGQVLKDHVITMTQDGNKVEVRAEYQGEKASRWFGSSPDLQVKYLFTIPRRFDVDLKSAGGGIKVADLAGNAQVSTSGGSLAVEKIDGPVTGRTSGGNINVASCHGPVEVNTSGGSVSLSETVGDVTAKTSGGSIRAENVTGKAVLKTSGGSITIVNLKSPAVEASTSGGSISADLAEPPAEACSFRTSGGSITVKLAAPAAVDVDLRTSGGRVSSDFPVTTVVHGEQNKNELHGKINGGGPLVTARTSGGNVRLEKK